MAPTHRWHPGAPAVAPRWTFPVRLLPDESIGSFLIRAALAHACSPKTLAAVVWPGWRAWTTDLDRGLATDRLRPLAQRSGIDASRFRAASIAPVAAQIEGRMPDANTGWRWILSRNAAAGKRTTQHCPQCLAATGAPYYRLHWRFAWHTGCPAHGSRLSDSCTECGAGIRPHQLEQTARDAAQCARCGADLRTSETTPCLAEALDFQRAADEVLRSGEGACFGVAVAAPAWFETAGFLVNLLRRAASQQTNSLDKLLDRLQVAPPSTCPAMPGGRIERLQVHDRERILAGVQQVMRHSADEFKAAVEESSISRQGLCERNGKMPAALAGLLTDLPERGRSRYVRRSRLRRGPRSPSEVARMMRRLERTLRSESP